MLKWSGIWTLILVLGATVRPSFAEGPREIRAPILSARPEATSIVASAFARPPALRTARGWESDAWNALRQDGWLWAKVALGSRGDTLFVEAGPRARILQISHSGADSLQWRVFEKAAGIEVGSFYRPGRWEEDSRRGLEELGNLGFAFASLTVRRIETDRAQGGVSLDLLLLPGTAASVGKVVVLGTLHTRPGVLAKLSGLRAGQPWSEERLQRAKERLEAREVVSTVVDAQPMLSGAQLDTVDVLLRVEQPPSTGQLSAALGVAQGDPGQGTRVYGTLDLSLLDLLGTARQLQLSFRDDGKTRRTLDVSYLEPLAFSSPFDLSFKLGQRHEDALYDMILGEGSLRLPWRGASAIELGGGIDRTTFVGDEGILRIRRRALARLSLGNLRPENEGGVFGRLESRLEYGRVSQTVRNPSAGAAAVSAEEQSLVDLDLHLGWALSSRLAILGRARWASISTNHYPLPRSEQFFIGGARTVRGHREDEVHGEIVSHGSSEFVVGPARGGQAYLFYDLGYAKETRLENGTLRPKESWISGFGMGLRTPAPFGRLDLSLGFAQRLNFDNGLIHLALINRF
ncbi:MAG TPA: POTRA domain-containing protein [Candidatus Krumholzibacteria bacterium]|nr:POTRA domain-containing protein [Candidatus Krumholzibacteria bacterium]